MANHTKNLRVPRTIPSIFFAMSFLAVTLFSVPVFAIDLLQTYQEALQNDPIYASARAALAAGQEKSVQGRALLLPNVNIIGSNTRTIANFSGHNRTVDSVKSDSSSYTLQLTQPLFHWEDWQQYKQSKLQVLASEALFNQAQLDLMVRVAQAYFDVLSAQDKLEAVRANKTAISAQLEFAKRNFEVGTNTITDQNEAQARYDLAMAQEFAAENTLEIQRYALQQIIGHDSGTLAALKQDVQLTGPEPANIHDWVSAAERNNYSVMNAEVTYEIAKQAIALNRAGHFPTVDLVASVNRSHDSAVPVDRLAAYVENSRNIGIQFNVPLFSGFAITSKVREAIALEDQAGNEAEAAKRNAALAAQKAFLGVSNGLAQVNAYQAAVISSKSALESNVMGYDLGIRINIDVLNAQQQLYTTEQNLAQARYDTIMNGLRLKLAAASLKEEDLAQLNRLLH